MGYNKNNIPKQIKTNNMKNFHYIHIAHDDINQMSVEQLQKIKIDLLDAQRAVRRTLVKKIMIKK